MAHVVKRTKKINTRSTTPQLNDDQFIATTKKKIADALALLANAHAAAVALAEGLWGTQTSGVPFRLPIVVVVVIFLRIRQIILRPRAHVYILN